jgi:hypothetical protein
VECKDPGSVSLPAFSPIESVFEKSLVLHCLRVTHSEGVNQLL